MVLLVVDLVGSCLRANPPKDLEIRRRRHRTDLGLAALAVLERLGLRRAPERAQNTAAAAASLVVPGTVPFVSQGTDPETGTDKDLLLWFQFRS